MQPLLRAISETIESTLNTSEPRKWGYVLIVAPLTEPPVRAEVLMNVTHESARIVMIEGVARIDGRLIEEGGKA